MLTHVKRKATDPDKPDNRIYQIVATSPHGYYTVFYDAKTKSHGTKLIKHSDAIPYVGENNV